MLTGSTRKVRDLPGWKGDQMRDQRALLLIQERTASGLCGRLVDDRLSPEAWVSVEVRFGLPAQDRSMSLRERFDMTSEEPARREAFRQFSATATPSSIVRLEHARGDFDPATGLGFVAAYRAHQVCSSAEAAELLSLPHEPKSEDSEALWRPRELSEFDRKIRALVEPQWNDRQFWPGYLRALEYESECVESEARHQSNEALVYVLGPKLAVLLETHGSYLFYAEGPDCQDVGMKPLPAERGIYFVRGKPWSYGPDWDNDYSSGFDVVEAIPATAEHFALFGVSGPETFRQDMDEYDADYDAEHGEDPEAVPAP